MRRMSGEYVEPTRASSARAGRGNALANRTERFADFVRKLFQPLF
jgi:hypothetical protein